MYRVTRNEKGGGVANDVTPQATRVEWPSILEPGWQPCKVANDSCGNQLFNFKCLTRRTPRQKAGKDPRGLAAASDDTLERWRLDAYSQSPYQFSLDNMVVPASTRCGATGCQNARRLIPEEEERLMGYPTFHTAAVRHDEWPPHIAAWRRQSLLGNSWHLGVVMFLLQAVLATIPTDGHTLHEVAPEPEVGCKALPRSRFLRNAASPKLLREYDSVLACSEKRLLALQYIQTEIYKVYIRNNIC